MQLYFSRINEVVRLNKELAKKQRSSEFKKKLNSFLDFYSKLENMEEVQDMYFELTPEEVQEIEFEFVGVNMFGSINMEIQIIDVDFIEIIEEPVKPVIEPLVEVLTFNVITTIRMGLLASLRGVKSVITQIQPFRIIGYG